MKILVVDDERDVQFLFEQKFRKEIRNGYHDFMFAFSGEEALKRLEDLPRESLLILSDINMPGMSGLVLLQKIKDKYHTPSPCVMMISAYSDEQNRSEASRLGADDFLTKPVDFITLKEKLEMLNV